jgi:hypothetical protein
MWPFKQKVKRMIADPPKRERSKDLFKISTTGIIHEGDDGRIYIDDGSYDDQIDEWFSMAFKGHYAELTLKVMDPPDEVMKELQEQHIERENERDKEKLRIMKGETR